MRATGYRSICPACGHIETASSRAKADMKIECHRRGMECDNQDLHDKIEDRLAGIRYHLEEAGYQITAAKDSILALVRQASEGCDTTAYEAITRWFETINLNGPMLKAAEAERAYRHAPKI